MGTGKPQLGLTTPSPQDARLVMRSLFPRVAFLTNALAGPCLPHTLFVLDPQLGVWVHTTTGSKQRAFEALAEHVAGRADTQSVLAAARAELSVSYRYKSEVIAMRNRARHLVVLRDSIVRFAPYSVDILPRSAVGNAFVYGNETVQASLSPFCPPVFGDEVELELETKMTELLGPDRDVFLDWLCSVLAGEKIELVLVIWSILRSTGKSLLFALLNFVFGDRIPASVNEQLFMRRAAAMSATAERQFNRHSTPSIVYCIDDAEPESICFDALKPMQSSTGGRVYAHGTGESLQCRMCPGFAATTNNEPLSLFVYDGDAALDNVLDSVLALGFGPASEDDKRRRHGACMWFEQRMDPDAGEAVHGAFRRDVIVMLWRLRNKKAKDPAVASAIATRRHELTLRQYLGREAVERNAAAAAAADVITEDEATSVRRWLEGGCRITHIRPEDRIPPREAYLRRSEVARAALGRMSERADVAAVVDAFMLKEFEMKAVPWKGVQAFRGMKLTIPIAPH